MVLIAVGNLWWLAVHEMPAASTHTYLTGGLDAIASLQTQPLATLGALFRGEVRNNSVSLFYYSTIIPYWLSGFSRIGFLFTSTLHLLIAMAAVVGTVGRLRRSWGMSVAAVALLSPAALIVSRTYSPYVAVMSATAVGVWLLVRSDWFARPWPAAACGLLAAVSLRLDNTAGNGLQVLVVLALVGMYTLLAGLVRPTQTRRRVLLVALLSVAVFAIAINYDFFDALVALRGVGGNHPGARPLRTRFFVPGLGERFRLRGVDLARNARPGNRRRPRGRVVLLVLETRSRGGHGFGFSVGGHCSFSARSQKRIGTTFFSCCRPRR